MSNRKSHFPQQTYTPQRTQHYVILRRDNTVAFQGSARSREHLLEYHIRQARGDGSAKTGSTAFHNLNLDGFQFHNLDACGVDFTGSSMVDMTVRNCQAHGLNLARCDLTGARIALFGQNAVLRGARLTKTNLDGSDVLRADLRGVVMDGASMVGARLDRPHLNRAVIRNSTLSGATLINPDLTGATFLRSDLSGATITNPELRRGIRGVGSRMRTALNTIDVGQDRGCSVVSCQYDSRTMIGSGFHAFQDDRRISGLASIAMTASAAILTGLSVEGAMKYAAPVIESSIENVDHWTYGAGIGVAILAGTTLLRESVTDTIKENLRSAMGLTWNKARDLVKTAVRAGTALKDVMCVVGPRHGVRAFNMALMAQGRQPGRMNILRDVLPGRGGQPLHFIACDRKTAALALEYLSRHYHGLGDGKQMNILLCDDHTHDPTRPCSIDLLPGGGFTATWFKDTADGLRPQMSVSYNAKGQVTESYDADGINMSPDIVHAAGVEDGKRVLRDFMTAIVQMPAQERRGLAFDASTSYVTATQGHGLAVRSARYGTLDNKYGPAMLHENGCSVFFRAGTALGHDDGWAGVETRNLPDTLVGQVAAGRAEPEDTAATPAPTPSTPAGQQGSSRAPIPM